MYLVVVKIKGEGKPLSLLGFRFRLDYSKA